MNLGGSMKTEELRYLQRLAELYPTIGKASTEIINLQSILNLPKEPNIFFPISTESMRLFPMCFRNGSGSSAKEDR